MAIGKNYILGVYDDDAVLVEAVLKARQAGVRIYECYTPFPVHGLDEALGYKPSNLPVVAFLCGLAGTTLALTMIISMLGYDWPMNIGGKPNIAFPAYIPITFEATVLLASFGMAISFFIVAKLKPWGKIFMFDSRSVHNKFVMAIDLDKNHHLKKDIITKILKDTGASEVNAQEIE
jgi:hypothetical protein